MVQTHIQYKYSYAKNGDHHEAKFTYNANVNIEEPKKRMYLMLMPLIRVAVIVKKVRVLFM